MKPDGLESIECVRGNIQSEREANNLFYSINKEKLKKIYNNKWVMVMYGGKEIEIFYDCISLFLRRRQLKERHKLCWCFDKKETNNLYGSLMKDN